MGWLERLFDLEHRRWSRHGDTADMAARASILANSRNDQERTRARLEAVAVPPVRWRWSEHRWQRWSELDVAFRDAEPPEGLVTHVESEGGPVDGRELAFVDGEWVVHQPTEATSDASEPGRSEAEAGTPADPVDLPRGVDAPLPGGDGSARSDVLAGEIGAPAPSEPTEPAAASFEEQLARWRRRR